MWADDGTIFLGTTQADPNGGGLGRVSLIVIQRTAAIEADNVKVILNWSSTLSRAR